jgi:uroporphyrinogen decarboxylase
MTFWYNCTAAEKAAMIEHCMDIYEKIFEKYHWDALSIYFPWGDPDAIIAAKKRFGNDVLIGSMVGMSIISIENVEQVVGSWMDFSVMMMDDPKQCHSIAQKMNQNALERIQKLVDAGADFIFQPNDVGFNSGPFISPVQFHEFCTPYLAEQVALTKKNGLFSFIHTDGAIMPILDELLSVGAHCFQSVDPMAGLDIAEVKKRCCGKMALMGNVQCSLLQDGPDSAIKASALYALESCGHDSGYIFGSSNTIFKGLPLKNYEYMLSVYHDFCKGLNQ